MKMSPFLIFLNQISFQTPMKGNKSEKIPITECVDDVLAAVEEMFMLIAERTNCENNNMGK